MPSAEWAKSSFQESSGASAGEKIPGFFFVDIRHSFIIVFTERARTSQRTSISLVSSSTARSIS